jgi:hypothetical protein
MPQAMRHNSAPMSFMYLLASISITATDLRMRRKPHIGALFIQILNDLRFHLAIVVCQSVPPGAERDRRLAFLDEMIES